MKKLGKKLAIILSMTMAMSMTMLSACGSTGSYATYDAYDSTESVSASTSASSGSYSGIAGSNSYSYSADYEEADSGDTDSNQTQDLDSMTLLEEKLVYYCDMSIETLDYDSTMTAIKDTIKKYDGVIQSEYENDSSYNWYYENYRKTSGTMSNYIKIRVPSANYESFVSELDGVGKITSKSTSVDNISQTYYDTTTRIEALEIQEQNLLEMMEKCETIDDMITVEERLSEVQYELNNLQTSKRYMDIDVAYSYVNLDVIEVMEYHYTEDPIKTNTFVDRLKNTLVSTGKGFLEFLEGLLFLVIRLLPYIILIAVICFIFRKKIKKLIAKHKEKKAAKRQPKYMPYQMPQQQVIQQQVPQQQVTQQDKAEQENNGK